MTWLLCCAGAATGSVTWLVLWTNDCSTWPADPSFTELLPLWPTFHACRFVVTNYYCDIGQTNTTNLRWLQQLGLVACCSNALVYVTHRPASGYHVTW